MVVAVSTLLFLLCMGALVAIRQSVAFAAWSVAIGWPVLAVCTYFFGPLSYRRYERRPPDAGPSGASGPAPHIDVVVDGAEVRLLGHPDGRALAARRFEHEARAREAAAQLRVVLEGADSMDYQYLIDGA